MTVWGRLCSIGRSDWVIEFHTNQRTVYTFGRHPSCSIVMEDMHISNQHLLISPCIAQDGTRQVIVEDSSSNGTWIEGKRLARGVPTVLRSGNTLVLPSDDQNRDYNFVFTIFDTKKADPSEMGIAHSEQEEQENEEWKELEKLQNEITFETSRLAAAVFINEEALTAIGKYVKPQQTAMMELREANRDLSDIISKMVASMEKAREELLAGEEREQVLETLQVDKYKHALDILQAATAETETVVDADENET